MTKRINASSLFNKNPALVMPIHLWAPLDQKRWHDGTDPVPSRRRQRHADILSPRSIEAAAQSYGRFCQILEENSLLEPEIGPSERVTYEHVALFVEELRLAGNSDNTIKTRLMTLASAMHILAPGENFYWITRPAGIPLDELLKQIPKEIFVPSSKTLFEWGLELMTTRPLPVMGFKRLETCRDYRNGLIIALLACRAPRLGSLAQMKLEKNLYKSKGEYWVRLESMIVKNRRELHYSLPAALTPYIDRYLAEIRPLLLDPASTNAVWGNGDGGVYTYRAIGTMIFRKSAEKFRQTFGAHRFRHSFASTLATLDPRNPGVAAAVLGISEAVLNEHYRRGRQADAALKTQAHLQAERVRTKPIADRAFGALRKCA